MKSVLEAILNKLKGEWAYIKGLLVPFMAKIWAAIVSAMQAFGRKLASVCRSVYDWVMSLSLETKVFVSMSCFLAFFLFWQFMAYNVMQSTFVMVNLLLVVISSVFTCIVIFTSHRTISACREKLEESEQLRKKKDQEISSLKREIHDMNIATRRQQSFGKNSQILIDTVKKNRAQASSDEPKGQFILKSLAQCSDICCGLVYMKRDNEQVFELAGEYATKVGVLVDESQIKEVTADDAILGEVIRTGKMQCLSDVPTESLVIMSGLGETETMNVYILPIKHNGEVVALAEVTSFDKLAIADIWKDIDNLLLDD